MKLLLYFLSFLFVFSCTTKHDNTLQELFEHIEKTPFKLLYPMIDARTGDTINIEKNSHTILCYIDSGECTVCNIRLQPWQEFLSTIDSKTDDDVDFILVLNMKQNDDILYYLRNYRFYYPIVFDSLGIMRKENHLPNKIEYTTFLLSENQTVLAIGNPTCNTAIAELYANILCGNLILDQSHNILIQIEDKPHNESDSQSILQKEIKNLSNDTIIIDHHVSSCDCINISITDTIIPPHGSVTVEVAEATDSADVSENSFAYIYYKGLDLPSIIQFTRPNIAN